MAKGKGDGPTGKVFSADAVAALLTSLSVSSLSMKQYELMSAMDGAKTASAFQHDFRSVLQKAKELKAQIDGGEKFEAVKAGTKRSAKVLSTPPVTPARPKATPKAPSKPRAKRPKLDHDQDDVELEPETTFSDPHELQTKFENALNKVKQDKFVDALEHIKQELHEDSDDAGGQLDDLV